MITTEMLMVFSAGRLPMWIGLYDGAAPTSNLVYPGMEIDDKYPFENKLEYLKFLLKISRMRNRGEAPPEVLLKQALETGRLAGISEEELNKL